MKYIFILGNNPELSIAEIVAVYPKIKIAEKTAVFLIGELADFHCSAAMKILGGTVKIGQVIDTEVNKEKIIREIISRRSDSKTKFGFSFYGVKPSKIGFEIKKDLKTAGIPSRLVVSKDRALSAVIVTKEKVIDFMILPNYLGLTGAVQDFADFGRRDYGRPKSDALSGMLPPKLARMMINLAQVQKAGAIADPFCGSGTILMEALDLGYANLIGSDMSERAVTDTKTNLDWFTKSYTSPVTRYKIFQSNIQEISHQISSDAIDAVITEPYLGPPIRGGETEKTILKIAGELENLYLRAFEQFHNIVKTDGKIVIVVPSWHISGRTYNLKIEDKITKSGFRRLDENNLIYKRPDQKIWRQIQIWKNE